MHALLKRFFYSFVFGNFFIAICAMAMVFSTFLMNGLPVKITLFTVFLTTSTFLLYNFHRMSFKLNYASRREMIDSLRSIALHPAEFIFYILGFILLFFCLASLPARIFPILLPLAILSLLYSIPLITYRKKKARLLEIFLIKTPVLALVWGVSTTIIPLIEQNISLSSSFVLLQVFSRSLFIFALCIPFEIRDMEKDKINNVKTIPVIFGARATKITGAIVILIEIVTHHFMYPGFSPLVAALDLSSLIALGWIFFQGKSTGVYFYKFGVDGTMLARFVFLFIAMHTL
jgi:hypothetical protein